MEHYESDKKGIYCPSEWWFRVLLVIQLVVFGITPDMREYLFVGIPVFAFYEFWSPSILLSDDGITLLYYGLYSRTIKWESITEVTISWRGIGVHTESFLSSFFLSSLRKNYSQVKDILSKRYE